MITVRMRADAINSTAHILTERVSGRRHRRRMAMASSARAGACTERAKAAGVRHLHRRHIATPISIRVRESPHTGNDQAVFSFLYFLKIKISKIYVRFEIFQKYIPVAFP